MLNLKPVKVEIDPAILKRLIKNKQMSVSDLRCLDGDSKHQVWEICLDSCAQQMTSSA